MTTTPDREPITPTAPAGLEREAELTAGSSNLADMLAAAYWRGQDDGHRGGYRLGYGQGYLHGTTGAPPTPYHVPTDTDTESETTP